MKQLNITSLLIVLLCMIGLNASAHDIEVKNGDDVTIYYNYINDNTELEVTYRGTSSSEYSNEYTGNVVIPESVTYNSNTYSVTSIGEGAFFMCYGLTSIDIPNSVMSIGKSAFSACYGLTSIDIPNSVTSIGRSAFSASGLTSVTIPNSVTSIGEFVFSSCSRLTSITIPNSVTSIGKDAFESCSKLTSVTIPNSVTSIGSFAFENCSGLTSVIIGNSVTNIGKSAFSGCSKLNSVYNEATTPQNLSSDNDPCFNYTTATLHVPAGTKALYKAANFWEQFSNIVDDAPTAINNVNGNANLKVKSIFSIDGKSISLPQKGIYIQKMSDGTTRKIVVD